LKKINETRGGSPPGFFIFLDVGAAAMITTFAQLGFSERDLLIIVMSGIFAGLGSFVQVTVSYWEGFPKLPRSTQSTTIVSKSVAIHRAAYYLSRLVVGFFLGVLLGLLLVGALLENVTVVARVLVLAALLGYSAPRIWEIQQASVERLVSDLVAQHLARPVPSSASEPSDQSSTAASSRT